MVMAYCLPGMTISAIFAQNLAGPMEEMKGIDQGAAWRAPPLMGWGIRLD